MPRYKEPFTLYKRKGKKASIWYYRCYSPTGERSCGRSTGKTSKTLARQYCQELIAAGKLWTGEAVTFRQYAEHFFDDNSQWVLERTMNGKQTFADRSLILNRQTVDVHLLPYFGKYKFSDIKPSVVKKYRIYESEKGLKNKSINNIIGVFSIIVRSAMADCVINFDPLLSVGYLPTDDSEEVNAFTREQIISMFSKKWNDDEVRLFSLIGALTGMRISEILAIRKDNLFEKYIDVTDQRIKYELKPLKTKEARFVPIPEGLYKLLKERVSDGFAFEHNDNYYRKYLYKNCGVKNYKEENLKFHSLRHFANTDMLAHNIPETKVRGVLGHSEGKGTMTDRYTNWRPEMFPEVYEWQEELIEEIGF